MKLVNKILKESYLAETYLNLFDKKDKERYANEVFEMLIKSYEKIGGIKGKGFKNAQDMVENIDFWKICKKEGKIIAVFLYKNNIDGQRKLVAIGTNGTKEGKLEFVKLSKDELKFNRSIREISGPYLSVISKLPGFEKSIVSFEDVEKLINKKIYKINEEDPYLMKFPNLKQFFYQREIGGEMQTKLLLGKDYKI